MPDKNNNEKNWINRQTMQIIDIVARLVLISSVTVLLLTRKENQQVTYFPKQTWSAREVVPVYWMLVLISLTMLILYKIIPERHLYQFLSIIITLFTVFILLVAARIIITKKRGLPPYVIGFKASDVYCFVILIVIQYSTLIAFFHEKVMQDYSLVTWFFVYISIMLVFWPVIEETFYLGMIFIPTSRIFGLLNGAVLISLLRTVIHFGNNLPALAISFIMGLLGCYLYIKIKGILVPLLLHSSFNFFVLIRDLNSFSV